MPSVKRKPAEPEAVKPEKNIAPDGCAKCQEYLNMAKRLKADYENLQKQTADEKTAFCQYANANLIIELLPILDNFKAAFNSVPENEQQNSWVIGLSHIKKQLADLLAANGVESIKTVGEKFDPSVHEAAAREPGEETDLIIREIKAGYKMHGKVIQCAKVAVGGDEVENNWRNSG